MLGGSLRFTVGKVLGYDKGIKLGYSYGKVLGTILGNLYVITLGIDVGIELGSLDGYLNGSNVVKIEGLLIRSSLGYTDDKLPGSDEGIKLVLFYGKFLGTILGNVY